MPDGDGLDELFGSRLADLSQELRTRLILILGPTRRLLRDANLTTAQRADLKTVFRNGNELLDLVNDLLKDARQAPDSVPQQRPPITTINPCSSVVNCGTASPEATSPSQFGSGAAGR